MVDDSWEEGYSHLVRFVERERHARVPKSHVEEDGYRLGQWVSEQRKRRARLTADQVARLSALPGWVWNTLDAAWKEGYAYLARFVEREHHALVPVAHVEDGYRLGKWVSHQRDAQRLSSLAGDQAARLSALPGWVWNTAEDAWEEGYAYLARFVEREHHARVPARAVMDGYQLGAWAAAQRSAYRARRLSAERADRLSALPGWDWQPHDAAWETGYSHLQRFVERKQHARVPQGYVEDGFRLGQWAGHQRSRHRAGRLSAERAARLAALPGWHWNPLEAAWEEGFSQLERFANREHHTRVPQKHVEDGFRLGDWAGKQRQAYRAGRLPPERAARFATLPGWHWNRLEADWEAGFSQL